MPVLQVPSPFRSNFSARRFQNPPVPRTRRSLLDRPVLFTLCAAALYLLTWAGHLDNGDSSYRIAWAKAMLFHHTARISTFGLGADYCKYSIGHSLLAMPFLAVAWALERLTHIHAEGPIYMLLFILNAAVFLALAARYLRTRFAPAPVRRALFLIGACTIWLPCSRMDSIEQLVLTSLFAGFVAVHEGRFLLGALVASYAIVIRPDALVPVVLLIIWAAWKPRRPRLALAMLLACLPALALNAGANFVRWGTIREAGYAGEPFSQPFLEGLYGILFSSGKSVFFYSPPLLLGVAALIRYARGGRGAREYWFFASVFISEVLLYANWWDWSGDDGWGVRFLTPGVILMCLPAVEWLDRPRWPAAAVALCSAGLCVQSLATLVDPLAGDYIFRNFRVPRATLYPGQPSGGADRVDVDDLRFHPRYSPLAVNWLLLRVLCGASPKLHGRSPTAPENSLEMERTGTPLFDSLMASGWKPDSVHSDLFWLHSVRRRP